MPSEKKLDIEEKQGNVLNFDWKVVAKCGKSFMPAYSSIKNL